MISGFVSRRTHFAESHICEDVSECVITKEVIDGEGKARYLDKDGQALESKDAENETKKIEALEDKSAAS